MKRALVILLGALLLAVFLLAATVVFLAVTDGGTRFLASQAERFLPIRLEDVSGALLREVRVGRVVLELDGQTLEIRDLAAVAQVMPLVFDNRLTLDSVSAESVALTSTGPGEDTGGPAPALQLPFMPLEIDVVQLDVGRLAVLDVFPMQVSASATWQSDGVSIRHLEVDSQVVRGRIEGRLGSGANPTLSATVTWALPDTDWGGEGRLQGRVDSLQVQHTLRGPVTVAAEGQASLAELTEPSVDVQVQVGDMAFGDVAIDGFDGRLSGTLANLSADADARVSVPQIEPFQVRVQAYGPMTGPLTVRNLTADAMGGTQEAQGSLAWQDDVRIRLGGSFEQVSLDGYREQLGGRVNGSFQFRYEDALLNLGLHDLSGTLNERPIGGELEVAQQADGWMVEPLQLQVGRNTLTGQARLRGAVVDLQGEFAAPALEALALGVSGDAAGRLQVSGKWPDFNGSASFSSTSLQGFDVVLRDAEITASMQDGALQGSLQAAEVERQTLTLEALNLGVDGTLERFDWQLVWADGEGAGSLRLGDDGMEVGLNQARLTALDHDWTLQEPTRVSIGERIEVAPLCIRGGDASACLEKFVLADGALETSGTLVRAPVVLLQPLLPLRLGRDGFLEGSWSLAGEPQALRGEVALAARQLAVMPGAGAEAESVDLPDLEADGTVREGVLQLRLAATDEAFSVVGEGRLEPLQMDGTLAGTVTVSATDLAPLTVFDQRVEDLGGSIEGNLDISGTPAAPRAEGRFHLRDGRLQLNDPDTSLSAMDVRLRLDDGGTFELRGTGRQRQQEISFNASGSGLFGGVLVVDADLQGEGLRAAHPDWDVTVSPDLDFTFAGGRGHLRGRIEVPQAEVRLTTLPSSVPSPSEDVVVVGRDTEAAAGANAIRVDVDVVLGEDVSLKALGIVAQLQGRLRARLDAQGQTTLRGTLDITGGVMSTQGQTLAIESGTVVYNGPVTRPYIDLRAVREIDDVIPPVKVGLHIRGDADNLTSSVFSEPAMSDTRALSFLVLGRDIDQQTASSDGNQLMAAAINMGLSRSKGITSELMRMTGLDELSATAETEESFAIVAGKRINDDLYVRYTYNTLSAVGAFLVRYELGSRWQLEARSGEQSAMDLMYSFEK
ncbi:MAG: translocation/assembly module TamB domain-containing protein [Gammaproteobacteria bacterium]|nr:translocation/assembly module TamB domain-containing protein [Gammaproteobacteria bacterium]